MTSYLFVVFESQIFYVINKPHIYFTSIDLSWFCQFLDLFENVVLAWYLQNAGSQKFISRRWEERSKDTDQNCFHCILFQKLAKKKTSAKMQTYFHFSYEKVMILSIHILYRIEINI